MRALVLITLLFISMTVTAQSDFDRSYDKENGLLVFKGQVTFDTLKTEPAFEWLNKGAEAYSPDKETLRLLQEKLPAYDLVVFMGTWCEDSHVLLPKLYKTLQAANYPLSQCKMYGVDRAKTTKYVEHRLYQIAFVPTIILTYKNQEIGRIVENVKQSIETDLADLIRNDKTTKP